MIEKLGTAMNADRLGSYQGTYPYGELQGAVGTPGEKFGTYWRDATGLDYAVNRYYSSQMGRFLTADPYVASGGAADSGSWNRYAYVQNDPVNWTDTLGLNRDFCEDPAEAPFIAACVQRTQNGQIGPILIPRFPTMEGSLLWAFAWFTGPPRSSGGGSPKQEGRLIPSFLLVTADCNYVSPFTKVVMRRRTYTVLDQYFRPMPDGVSVAESVYDIQPSGNKLTTGGVWLTGGAKEPSGGFNDFYGNGGNTTTTNALQQYFSQTAFGRFQLTVLEPNNYSGDPKTYAQYPTQGLYFTSVGVRIDYYWLNPIVGSTSPCPPPVL